MIIPSTVKRRSLLTAEQSSIGPTACSVVPITPATVVRTIAISDF
jgi:hypothetical protein